MDTTKEQAPTAEQLRAAADRLAKDAQEQLAAEIAVTTSLRVERDLIEDASDLVAQHLAQQKYHQRLAEIHRDLRDKLVQAAIVRREG